MKTRNQWRVIKFVLGTVALCAFAITAQSTVLIDEEFASGYNRTVNNIGNTGNGNLAWYKSRYNETATVNVGSLSFSAAANNGSEAYFGYFTDPAQSLANVGLNSSVNNGKLWLGVGDTLVTSVSFYLTSVPSDTSTYQVRWGVFDTAVGRSMNDFNGGASSTMFSNNPGFATFLTIQSSSTNNGVAILKHTGLTSTGLFATSGDYTQLDGGVGGAFPGVSNGENVTLRFTVEQEANNWWELTSGLYDTVTGNQLEFGVIDTNDATVVNSFSMIGLRVPRMADSLVGPVVFTDINVSVVPEPSTLMLAGTGLALALVAIRRRRS